jgi:hypothetical protein
VLTVLTIATVVIAFVLVIAHWKRVSEALLWLAAIVSILAFVASLIAFGFALVYLEIGLALLGLGLLALAGLLAGVEEWDRNRQWKKYHAQLDKINSRSD